MSSLTIIQLFKPTVLTGSAATIFTMPTSPPTVILRNGRVRFANTSNAAQAVTAYAVPNGGSAGAGNCFMNAETIAANSHLDSDLPVMAVGDFLQAFAGNASDVTITELDGVIFNG